MSATMEISRERIHRQVGKFGELIMNATSQDVEPIMLSIIDQIYDDVERMRQEKAEKSEIKELIIEMREGFRRMDERFEAVDKRFDDLIHQMDKRFEAMDKRFDDLIHYMDKRFDDLIHQMDKRFESLDKRFNAMQWMLGLGMSLLAFLLAFFNYTATLR